MPMPLHDLTHRLQAALLAATLALFCAPSRAQADGAPSLDTLTNVATEGAYYVRVPGPLAASNGWASSGSVRR